MSAIRHNNLSPFSAIATGMMISFDQQQAGEFAMCSSRRLKTHSIHPRNLT